MTITILSLVCIVLAALCLCLWVYAANAAQDAAEAMWELDQAKWETVKLATQARQDKERELFTHTPLNKGT